MSSELTKQPTAGDRLMMTESFGSALRRIRTERQVSLRALARKISYDFGYLGQVERGERAGSGQLARQCDLALGTGGILHGAFTATRIREDQEPTPAHTLQTSDTWTGEPAGLTLGQSLDLGRDDLERRGFLVSSTLALGAALAWPSGAVPSSGPGSDARLISVSGPPGRIFAGSAVPAVVTRATANDHVVLDVPTGLTRSQFLRRPEHALLIGQVGDGRDGLYAVDTRYARQRLARAAGPAHLPVPDAYLLDELTLGIIWAIANLDDGLLGDDAALASAHQQLSDLGTLDRSSAGRDAVSDLTPVSQAWLGSDFCARHIIRHSSALTEAPGFWTCERNGEDASGWLFFAHKYGYLKASTRGMRPGQSTAPVRSFCIPPAAVACSGAPERLVLLLAAALMEAFGIRIDVCTDPDYTQVEGFVSDGRHAIVANWVDSASLWHVDVTDRRPTLREYADASAHASANSITPGRTSPERLRQLATYLSLDWTRVVRRCYQLGEYGLGGLAAPRSRLLSVEGAEHACRFLGGLPA